MPDAPSRRHSHAYIAAIKKSHAVASRNVGAFRERDPSVSASDFETSRGLSLRSAFLAEHVAELAMNGELITLYAQNADNLKGTKGTWREKRVSSLLNSANLTFGENGAISSSGIMFKVLRLSVIMYNFASIYVYISLLKKQMQSKMQLLMQGKNFTNWLDTYHIYSRIWTDIYYFNNRFLCICIKNKKIT